MKVCKRKLCIVSSSHVSTHRLLREFNKVILYLAHGEIIKVRAGKLIKLLGFLVSFPSYVLPILLLVFIPLLTVKL